MRFEAEDDDEDGDGIGGGGVDSIPYRYNVLM